MTSLIIRLFIKDHENVSDVRVRTSYGKVAAIVCIVCNILLFAFKLFAGLITHSIAVTSDAINNLSDASGNILSLVGFKLASKAPDEKHPYGHARYEYFTGLAVSVMITAIGFSLGKESVEKIIHPADVDFSYLSLIILAVSVAVKFWMYLFNKKTGALINSDALRAAAADSRNDVITTSAVILSAVICRFTGIAVIDGIMGMLVSLFIIYSGISLIRETLSPLLGEAPDKELVANIEKKVMSYPGVLGMHDLMVH
ncbi:MAG: cation transporter, partial [Clostridia bacterium]|nr:cation transporter [Clostridia bacterium]